MCYWTGPTGSLSGGGRSSPRPGSAISSRTSFPTTPRGHGQDKGVTGVATERHSNVSSRRREGVWGVKGSRVQTRQPDPDTPARPEKWQVTGPEGDWRGAPGTAKLQRDAGCMG